MTSNCVGDKYFLRMTTKILLRSNPPLGNVDVTYRQRQDQLLPSKIQKGANSIVTSHNMWKPNVSYDQLLPTRHQEHSEKGLQAARAARDNILGKMIGENRGSGLKWDGLSVPKYDLLLTESNYADRLRNSWATVKIPEGVDDFDLHPTLDKVEVRRSLPHPARANRELATGPQILSGFADVPTVYIHTRPKSTTPALTRVAYYMQPSEAERVAACKKKLHCGGKPAVNQWVFLRENIEKTNTVGSDDSLCVNCCCCCYRCCCCCCCCCCCFTLPSLARANGEPCAGLNCGLTSYVGAGTKRYGWR
jgi:hypothetical protein